MASYHAFGQVTLPQVEGRGAGAEGSYTSWRAVSNPMQLARSLGIEILAPRPGAD